MGRLRKREYTRKAGMQVPQHVTDLLHRLHPTVQVLWHTNRRRWCMVGFDKGGSYLICMIEGRDKSYAVPSIANTVSVLNRLHWRHIATAAAKQRLEADLDSRILKDAMRKKREKSDQIREGSIALFNKMTNRVVAPVRPALVVP